MELDVRLGDDSLTIPMGNPHRLDIDVLVRQIEGFSSSRGVSLAGLDLMGLIPRMIKGIAGCEAGCPANAKSLVSQGYRNFRLAYVEGGILTAEAVTEGGTSLSLRMFPDF
jgi:hypothetical protein